MKFYRIWCIIFIFFCLVLCLISFCVFKTPSNKKEIVINSTNINALLYYGKVKVIKDFEEGGVEYKKGQVFFWGWEWNKTNYIHLTNKSDDSAEYAFGVCEKNFKNNFEIIEKYR